MLQPCVLDLKSWMWFAILVTLLAATGNNIGKALQKEAVHSLPRFSVQPAILRQAAPCLTARRAICLLDLNSSIPKKAARH